MFPSITAPCRLASFDVFDTVLGRRWPRPSDVFVECARLLALDEVETFKRLRIESEFALRKQYEFRREVTLEQIALSVAAGLGGSRSAEQIIEAELAAERSCIYAVPAAITAIREARDRGIAVAFVTDTYLPREFIQDRLVRLDLMQQGDLLLVSSEHGSTKSTGELFYVLLRQSGCRPEEIHHVGDNVESDIVRAKAIGMIATRVAPTQHLAHEEADDPDSIVTLRLKGACRAARICSRASNWRESIIWDSTVRVAGPLLSFFARWCAEQARLRGIERLYFLARDGQIVHKITRASKSPVFAGFETKYLHVSRQALLLPATNLENLEPELDWILARTHVLTPRIALRRIALEPESHRTAMATAGFPPGTWDRQLDAEARERLKKVLLGPMREPFKASVLHARRDAIAYMRQEGLLDGRRFALVDVGWNGTLQRSIGRMLEIAGCGQRTLGLYLGLRTHKKHRPDDEMIGCIADVGRASVFHELDCVIPLIELFFSADHAGVVGYEAKDGLIISRLKAGGESRLVRWGVRLQHEAALALESHLDGIDELGCSAEWRRHVLAELKRFSSAPSKDEAEVYGDYDDAEDQNESYTRKLAAPFGLVEAVRYRLARRLRHHNEWAAASIALTPIPLRLVAGFRGVAARGAKASQIFVGSLAPIEGFGPEEGPYPEMRLPRFTWAYGPEATVELPVRAGPTRLRAFVSTLFPDQRVTLMIGRKRLAESVVPPGDETGQHPSTVIDCLVPAGPPAVLKLVPSFWANGDRPLAIVVVRMALESIDAH